MEKNAKLTSAGAVVSALVSAPCFISLLLIPLGLGAFMSTSLFLFLDDYRFVFMGLALVAVGFTHLAVRRGSHFHPIKTMWVITFIVVALIAAELIVDPPWARHVLVPM